MGGQGDTNASRKGRETKARRELSEYKPGKRQGVKDGRRHGKR